MGSLLVTPDVQISGSYTQSALPLLPAGVNVDQTLSISGSSNMAAIISKDSTVAEFTEGEVLSPRPGTSTVAIGMTDIIQRHSTVDKVADRFINWLVPDCQSIADSVRRQEVGNTANSQMVDTYRLQTGNGSGTSYTAQNPGTIFLTYPDYVTEVAYEDFFTNQTNYWLGTPWDSKAVSPGTLFSRSFIPGQFMFWSWYICYSASRNLTFLRGGTTANLTPWTQSKIAHYGILNRNYSHYSTSHNGTLSPAGKAWNINLTMCDNGTDLVFYYINDWGGLDWFNPQVKAKEVKTDNIERSTYRPTRATTKVYQQKRTRSWRIKSGMLLGSNVTRCQELLKARRVWMHMPQKGYMAEVIVQDRSVQDKTFQNQDRRWPSYEFTVQEVKEISLR